MTYTKTIWVNGSAPAINATNLNKIEDGIFDNDAAFNEHLDSIFPHKKFAYREEVTYTSEKITQIDTLISDVLRMRELVTYDDENIEKINIKLYDEDGVTLLQEFEDTVSYDNGKIDEIVRVVI